MLKSNKNEGFTIIEALVAIAVLMMALGGPLVLAVSSIGDARASKNKVTAFYLAEEALEYVRNVRDSNFLQRTTGLTTPWLDGLNNCIGSGQYCYFDVFDLPSLIAGCGTGCPLMEININNHYGYTGTDSIFTRYITIDNSLNSGNEIKVTVTVVWIEHGTTKWVALTQNMFNLAP